MARLRSRLRRRRVQRLLRSLLRRLHHWLVGMAERCCRARRCGLVSLVVVSREVSRLRARAVVVSAIVMTAESVVDVGGIAGVDAMNSGDAGASVLMRRGPKRRGRMRRGLSIVRSRAGLIRRRLCSRR